MSFYPAPRIIDAEVWTTMPSEFRIKNTSPAWAAANKPGRMIDSFLEGPSFDRDGNLWVTDIPYGRIFRISPDRKWSLVAEYDGWPNGLKFHRDGRAFIADYKNGIMVLDPATGTIEPVVTHRHSEHFRGCNDLVFDSRGTLYFTDQGQSGMHMPNGRVYRYQPKQDRLDLLIDTGQSPNGIVLNEHEDALYVAMTRGNSVWRLPLMADGSVSKVGVFVQLSGGLSGPDGLAVDSEGGLWIAHAGNGCVWGVSKMGAPTYRVVSQTGVTTTNLAFGNVTHPGLFITESDTGNILHARLSVEGRSMFG
ncbi:SMP-30/gluconolactonase/LRE family protein [uncultured Paracoccus sp.]|uniref:SMP-30/gluconolactonase/LRE family protein n=1 Tax=uncultured Paracoccus sp. TaxID=189685 RepID=UPI002626D216|nr:SMP-30/gluconolactonase/LRE family protein [uncultured Paracoccus sp.]